MKTGVVKIDQCHLDFANRKCEIINKCEDALFGQLLQDMFDNEARDTQLRRVYDKTARFYALLPEEFTTQDVMKTFGYTKTSAASRKCDEFIKHHVCEKIQRGIFRKLAKAI
jgi:hypothetical protein